MNKVICLRIFAWSLSSVAALVAVIAWGQDVQWHIAGLSTYRLFPLFGLLAFSLMWSHYIVSMARQQLGLKKEVLHRYFEATSLAVLTVILAHPGLLEWQLLRDGFGWPPGSVLDHYVAPSLKIFAVLGMVSLLVFLTYELRRWYAERPWWQYVGYATDAAMVAIFIHSLKLGTQLQHGWLRMVWYFYGLSLAVALGYLYYYKLQATDK